MKIKTSDGKIFDVPEENLDAFLTDYETAQQFEQANQQLADTEKQLNPGGDYGLERNFVRGLVPGAARVEGAIRSIPSGFQDYSKYRDWARQSADEYAAAHPEKALAATLGGAFIPSAVAIALSFGAGTGAGALNMARAANTIKTASTLNKMGRGLASSAALGATYGFMDEPSESLADRLSTAEGSAIFGGLVGGATPGALKLAGGVGNAVKRFSKGLSKEALPASKVEDFILNSNVLQNTPEGSLNAEVLRRGAASGALDVYKPAYNLAATLDTSAGMRKPGLLINTATETTPAARIIEAAETPQLKQAKQKYAQFVASVEDTPGQGLVADQFLKRNPVAKKILSVEPSMKGLKKGSFEWFQQAERTLNNSLPKNVDTDRLIGRRASINKSIEDLSKVRETIHPGTTEANVNYAIGKAWQDTGNKTVSNRLKYIANMPVEGEPSISSKDLLGILARHIRRGKARELIEKGNLYQGPSETSQAVWQILNNAGFNTGRMD